MPGGYGGGMPGGYGGGMPGGYGAFGAGAVGVYGGGIPGGYGGGFHGGYGGGAAGGAAQYAQYMRMRQQMVAQQQAHWQSQRTRQVVISRLYTEMMKIEGQIRQISQGGGAGGINVGSGIGIGGGIQINGGFPIGGADPNAGRNYGGAISRGR